MGNGSSHTNDHHFSLNESYVEIISRNS